MSTMCNQSDSSLQAAAGVFIWFLQVSRQSLGLSVERAAHLAGIGAADWQAIEAGRLPEPRQLRPMAQALALKLEQLAVLVRIRRKACEA